MVDAWYRAPGFAGAETSKRHPCAAIAAGRGWISAHSRCHLHRLENDAVSVQLWTEFLSDLCADDKPAGDRAAARGQSGERPYLSKLRAEDGPRRQRYCRHSIAGID